MALTTTQKAGWGLADLGLLTFVMIKQVFILSFLTNFLGVPIFLAGWTTTSILLFDLLTDPLVGGASDRTKSRFGRRAPWMISGSVAMVGGTIGMFSVPYGLNEVGNLIWFNVGFAIATVGYTMIAVPYTAMGAEISHSSEDWKGIRGFRVAFATLGLIIGGILIPYIANDTRDGFAQAAYIVAPIMLFAIWISVVMTRNAHSVFQPIRVADQGMFQHVYANKAFIALVVIYGLMALAVAIIMAGFPFFSIFLFTNDGTAPMAGFESAIGMLSFMFVALLVGSIISQPIWGLLSKHLGAVITLIVSILMFIALQVTMYVNIPNSNALIIFFLFVFAGAVTTAYRQVPWLIYPDLIEATQRRTGEQIEGVFQIAWLFGQRLAYAIAPLVLGAALGLSNWQTSLDGIADQSAETIDTLTFGVTLLPGIFLVIALFGLIAIYLPLARYELAILREGET
ncbi:MAG: MFS transporter [Pseudomonadota bacterium]